MDSGRFDTLARALAAPGSRRRLLGGAAGGVLAALAVAGDADAKRKRRRGRRTARVGGESKGGNSRAAQFCRDLFAPGRDRGRCVSDAAQGKGLFVQCAGAANAVCCDRSDGACASYAAAACCTEPDTCGGNPDAPGACGSASCAPDGLMRCAGTGFVTCDGDEFVYRDCAPGTQCRPIDGGVLCDWPENA